MMGTSNQSDFVFCQLRKFCATEISVNKLNLNLNLPQQLVLQETGFHALHRLCRQSLFFKCSHFTVHT